MTADNIPQPDDSRNPSHSTLTSLARLFDRTINGMQVRAIEIPLFQRDYAQGRHNEQARLVRTRFVADLCVALDGDQDLHLDFIFGDVVEGTLYPLDGQQRLTTLFLLHCYLAWHQQEPASQQWYAFRYATRPGARKFCEFLTQCHPDMATENLSAWLCDQARYLPTWKHDPTIQGMLVVLDAFHEHYRGQPPALLAYAWKRLTKEQAISFLLLPVAAQKLNNTLYVKMNSRGRPLTEFEDFKAEFEALLYRNPAIDPAAVKTFSEKIDTDWADLLWGYRDDNNLIDEEFMRYLRFLMEVRAWWRGHNVQTKQGGLEALMDMSNLLLGSADAHAEEDFVWITQALDVWLEYVDATGNCKPKAVAKLFSELFTREASNTTTPLRVFNFRDFSEEPFGVDMFHACCALYGTRPWRLPHTVLFYGVLKGLMANLPLPDLHPRLRLLRNLIEGSEDEIRADDTRNNMPALLREVDSLMANGPLAEVKTFNKAQVRNEQAKQALVAKHPSLLGTLNHLEDHELLRGGLTVFDLSPTQDVVTFIQRAAQFFTLFDGPTQEVSAALLAKGHEGRTYRTRDGYRFTYLGATKTRQTRLWENHWRARNNEDPHPSSVALMALLDDMASGISTQTVVEQFTNSPKTPKDWRYYLVKYAAMRSTQLEFAGNYVIADGAGYAICIPKSDSCDGRSFHHDAYLLALVQEASIAPANIDNEGWPRCFPGDQTEARYLKLRRSGLQIRCLESGWGLSNLPTQTDQRQAFDQVASKHLVSNGVRAIPQSNGVDIEDRIVIGAALLRDLEASGL